MSNNTEAMTKPLEEHIAELQEVIDGPNGRYWAHGPAFKALITALEQARSRIAELESRAVKLPKEKSMLTRDSFAEDYKTCNAVPIADVAEALATAGVKIEGANQ